MRTSHTRFAGAFIALSVLMAGLVAQLTTDQAGAATAQSFLIETGSVAATDGSVGTHTHFEMECPFAEGEAFPVWLTDAEADNPGCEDGRMQILVSEATNYYREECTPDGCFYPRAQYDTTIVPGNTLRVGGTFVREGGEYRFLARYVWNPGTNVTDPPPNPRPSQPCTSPSLCTSDYNWRRRFVVDATVAQRGSRLVANQGWSDKWGLVVNEITDYFKNDHVEQIAAAHRDPITLDPQLVITTQDSASGAGGPGNLGATKFWIETYSADCDCFQYEPSTKTETVVVGAELRVAGSYAWGMDGDWRFIANYVWRPAPQIAEGRISFNVETTRTSESALGTHHYNGHSLSGDGQLNPSDVTLDLAWDEDESLGIWTITGTWSAVRSTGTRGSLSGTISGTWNPGTGATKASVVVQGGSGVHCNVSGGGDFTGTNLSVDAPPTDTFNGSFSIKAARDVSRDCASS